MLKKNDTIDIDIDDLTVEGAGVGRHEGMAVFVPRALPGETVRARVIKPAKSYAVARLDGILAPSPERVTPFCGVFEACGGCTLQHLAYEAQLKYKARHIKECFARIGGLEISLPHVEPAANIRDYRNKAAFAVAEADGRAEAGFYAPRSHRLVACDCPIQKHAINDVKNSVVAWANSRGIAPYDEETHAGLLRHIVVRQSSRGETMAGVVLRDWIDAASLADALKGAADCVIVNRNADRHNAILGGQSRTVFGDGVLTEYYDGLAFRAGLASFLQVNYEQSKKLYRLALREADMGPGDTVFDLYCGIGTISLPAARKAKVVLGIEYMEEAAQNARDNARLNGLGNAAFLAGDAGRMIDEGIGQFGAPDIVILDPPRKGCDLLLIQRIVAAAPKRIVYVSCNASTLARDVALFNGYNVDSVMGVDMFPHTTHVECIMLLQR